MMMDLIFFLPPLNMQAFLSETCSRDVPSCLFKSASLWAYWYRSVFLNTPSALCHLLLLWPCARCFHWLTRLVVKSCDWVVFTNWRMSRPRSRSVSGRGGLDQDTAIVSAVTAGRPRSPSEAPEARAQAPRPWEPGLVNERWEPGDPQSKYRAIWSTEQRPWHTAVTPGRRTQTWTQTLSAPLFCLCLWAARVTAQRHQTSSQRCEKLPSTVRVTRVELLRKSRFSLWQTELSARSRVHFNVLLPVFLCCRKPKPPLVSQFHILWTILQSLFYLLILFQLHGPLNTF